MKHKLLTLTAFVASLGSQGIVAQCTSSSIAPDPEVSQDPKGQRLIHDDRKVGQTFRIPSGCFTLSEIRFSVAKDGKKSATDLADLTVEIYGTDPATGAPAGTALASTTVSRLLIGTSLTPDVSATFATTPQLAGGANYAAVFSQAGGGGQAYYYLGLAPGNPYPDGAFYVWDPGAGMWGIPGQSTGLDVRLSVCLTPCATACVRGHGYFKKAEHWPTALTALSIGSRTYSKEVLLDVLKTSASEGNALQILSYQLIAAKLNQIAGVSVPSAVLTAIASADALIGDTDIVNVQWHASDYPQAISLAETLAQYVEGKWIGGPLPCASE